MKRIAVVLTALLAACSSSSGLIETNEIEGGPGQDISVSVGGLRGAIGRMESAVEDTHSIDVEVANNSDAEVTVKRISIAPHGGTAGPYRIEPMSRSFDQTIEDGKEHVFTLNVRGKQVRPVMPDESGEVIVRVVVALANGDSYFYSFAIPVNLRPVRSP